MSINPPLPVADSGFWAGQAGGLRDDRLCGDQVVQSTRSHPKLDALLTDR